jgi:glutaredoxin
MNAGRFALLAALIAAPPAVADVYKWTDAQGGVHYSDSAPPDTRAQQVRLKINSIQGPAVVSTLGSSNAAKAKDKVRIYTAVWCGYCKKAKAHLAAKRVPYDEVDVEGSDGARREFARLGGRGVPVILVGNQRMDGFSADQLDAMLAAAGW